jgi:hypothetical protein
MNIRVISGSAEMENSFAAIQLVAIGGKLRAVNSFGDIDAEELRGPVDVTSENGSVRLFLDERLGGTSSISIMNGTLKLAVWEEADVHLLARTTGGKIQTFLPVEITRDGLATTAEHRFGKGRDSLNISGSNASIIIVEDL